MPVASGVILAALINFTFRHGGKGKKMPDIEVRREFRVNISFGVNEGNNEINDDSGIYCILR